MLPMEDRNKIIDQVAKRYRLRHPDANVRTRAEIDPEEVRQVAHLAILRAVKLYDDTLPIETLRGYAYRAAQIQVGEWLWRQSKIVSAAQHKLGELKHVRVRYDSDTPLVLACTSTPMETMMWRRRVWEELARIADEHERDAVPVLTQRITVKVFAESKNIPVKHARRLVRALKKKLCQNRKLRTMWHEGAGT